MSAVDRVFASVTRLGLDTPIFIYLIERHPKYLILARTIFDRIDAGVGGGYSSVIIIVAVLTQPKKRNELALERDYNDILIGSEQITLLDVDAAIANTAADLRARHNLRTPDAIQIATALAAGCEAILTNDRRLRRVNDIRVIVLDELTLAAA